MATFQFQRSHKAPSQENHESFFKQQGSHESHFFSSTQATSSQAIAQRQEDTLNSSIQRQEEPQKEEIQTKTEVQLMEEPQKEEV